MIQYEGGHWGVGFIFTLRGSVFQRAVIWAIPNSALTVLLHWYLHNVLDFNPQADAGISTVWSIFCFALAFLSVFRTQQAYSRFTEGADHLQKMRGNWFNVASSLVAFCSSKEEKHQEVVTFQNLIVRLISMLHCAAIRQVADLDQHCLQIICARGIDARKLNYLKDQDEKCEILLQWVQRSIVDAMESGVLSVPPPVISRAFQELSNGQVAFDSARKINDIPFPFPYAQMITVMLLIQWIITPVICGYLVNNLWMAGVFSFIAVCAFWALNYIAAEIEMPFGSDLNDLPVVEMQAAINTSLLALLSEENQVPPQYTRGFSSFQAKTERWESVITPRLSEGEPQERPHRSLSSGAPASPQPQALQPEQEPCIGANSGGHRPPAGHEVVVLIAPPEEGHAGHVPTTFVEARAQSTGRWRPPTTAPTSAAPAAREAESKLGAPVYRPLDEEVLEQHLAAFTARAQERLVQIVASLTTDGRGDEAARPARPMQPVAPMAFDGADAEPRRARGRVAGLFPSQPSSGGGDEPPGLQSDAAVVGRRPEAAASQRPPNSRTQTL